MADDGRYEILKTKLNNDFFLGDNNAPLKIIEAKRILLDYTMPANSKVDSDAHEGDDRTGLAFTETQEWIKTAPCYGCGGKGHLLSVCKNTPPGAKESDLRHGQNMRLQDVQQGRGPGRGRKRKRRVSRALRRQ